MDLFEAFALTMGILMLVAPFLIVYRNRRRSLGAGSDVPVGTPKDLEKAEAELSGTKLEVRNKMLETWEPVALLDSFEGITQEYVNGIIQDLFKNEINATSLFHEAIAHGVAGLTVPTGTYEIFVEKGKTEAATQILRKYISK